LALIFFALGEEEEEDLENKNNDGVVSFLNSCFDE